MFNGISLIVNLNRGSGDGGLVDVDVGAGDWDLGGLRESTGGGGQFGGISSSKV
jgi:hypothetical protein